VIEQAATSTARRMIPTVRHGIITRKLLQQVLRPRSRQAARLGVRVILRQMAVRPRLVTGVLRVHSAMTVQQRNQRPARRIRRKQIRTVQRITTVFRQRALQTVQQPSRAARHGRKVPIQMVIRFITAFRMRLVRTV